MRRAAAEAEKRPAQGKETNVKPTTVLFDLDGTLLPMDNDIFTKGYFKMLATKLAGRGYEPKQLIDAIWQGIAAMVQNDGTRSNEAAFWVRFAAVLGDRVLADKPFFEAFYRNDFPAAQVFCGKNPLAAKAVRYIKAQGFRVALATNPIFPAVATETRIRWAGLEPADFELYTTYENTGFCKPNPGYYRDVAGRLGVQPADCLMVGNDVTEDMVARTTGMQVFLLTDCMINRENRDIAAYPHGSFPQLMQFVDSL